MPTISDKEFYTRLTKAKESRFFTVDELSRMCKTPPVTVQGWLDGLPPHRYREEILRSIE